jgi:hypothetical protein
VLLGLDENTWICNTLLAISSNGIVVGYVVDANGNKHGCWFDILASNPSLNLLEDAFPEIVDGSPPSSLPIDVNSSGEVLTENGWVVNVFTGSSLHLPSGILTGGVTSKSAINELGTVIGFREGVGGPVRYNIHTEQLDLVPGSDSSFIYYDLNNVGGLGEFCGYADVDYTYRRNQTKTRQQAFRWRDGPNFDWLSDPALPTGTTDFISGESLNDSGDVVGTVSEYHPTEVFFYGAFLHFSDRDSNGNEIGSTYLIRDLVNNPYLITASFGSLHVTERDASLATPAPFIVGSARVSDTERKMFILIPEELPPSSTYSSTDTPIAIPDYNPANPQGISSTISVLDDVTITGLTVNLNITHPQPGSLLVYLYGPDNGPPVPLFNVSGDNNVPDFDGISSMGDWTLEVYDTVKKKTGTLNGWSITIDQ